MSRQLQVNVQVDKLPDINGDPAHYFGVRLSAWIVPDGPDRAQTADQSMLLPWQWTGSGTPNWTPTAPTSWKVWWIDLTRPTIDPHHPANPPTFPATPANVSPIGNPAASVLPDNWRQVRDSTVVDLAQVPARLEGPGRSQNTSDGRAAPVSDRTLFGLVESLSAFPSPWPEAHKVWTCLRIDTPAPSKNSELVVVPVFGINAPGSTGSYSVSTAPASYVGTPSDHFWSVIYTGTPVTIMTASAVVDRLAEADKIGSRILLKDKFLVRQSSWARVSDQDWMIQLPMQIADILDPAQVFTKALEQFLPHFEDYKQAATLILAANRTPQQSALVAISAPTKDAERAALRLLLGALHWRVLAACATGTRGVTPLPVALARANVSADSRNLLAGLTARDAGRPALDGTVPGFMTSERLQVWTNGHLETLLNVPPDQLKLDWGFRVDTMDGLRSFLISHWADPPTPAPPASPTWPSRAVSLSNTAPITLMRLIATRLRWNGATWSIVPDQDRSFGLLDLSGLNFPGTASISFAVHASQANAVIIAKLWFDGVSTAVATVTSAAVPTGDGHALTLTVASVPATFAISIDNFASVPVAIADPQLASRRAFVTLQLQAAGAKVTIKTSDSPSLPAAVQQLLSNTPDSALRANAAVAHAAPFIPPILSGIGPDGRAVTLPPLPGGLPAPPPPPPVAIALALAAWAADRFNAECEAAIKIVEDLAPPPPAPPTNAVTPVTRADITAVEPLFRYIAKYSAVENANGQIQTLLASLGAAIDYTVSVKATPVVFPIDQPQPIDSSQDIWSIFAGMGVLAGTSTSAAAWPDCDIWYSLNLANMYVSAADRTTPLPDGALVQGPKGGFDPVPLQIGEVGGVRAASVSYENRSLVGEMAHESAHTSNSAAAAIVPRRIEAYKFPTAANGLNAKLPALCFGKRYFFLPYLLGHGGALPVCLRANSATPTTLRPKTANGDPVLGPNRKPIVGKDGKPIADPGGRIVFTKDNLADDLVGVTDDATGLPVTPDDLVRVIDYRRTTPVAAPRIYGEKSLPGIPNGVEALASEIPVLPTAITIGSLETAFFYCNRDKTEGVLDFMSADPTKRALQIVFGGLPFDANARAVNRPDIEIGFAGRGISTLLPPIVIPGLSWPADTSLGLRLTINSQTVEIAPELPRRPNDPFVERPPRYGTSRAIRTQPTDFGIWQAFFVSITNGSADDVTLLPPIVSIGEISKTNVVDFHQIPLPGSAQQKRVITILDGTPSASPDSSAVALRIRCPAVEFSTYERWINWDLSDGAVRTSLDAAYQLVAQTNPTRNDDLIIDDPAVERIVVELIELFPNPQLHDYAPLAADWSSKASILNGFKTDRAADPRLPVRVAPSSQKTVLSKNSADGSAKEILLASGGVYEIRFYGAVPEDKQSFADSLPASAARFGKGVWQGLRKLTVSGKKCRLGAPLIRTFEVATQDLPTLFDEQTDSPMSINRLTALTGSGDRAQITLDHDFVQRNYPAIRYVNQLSLLSQRWGWRGLPLGTLPALAEFKDSANTAPRPVPGFSPSIEDHGRRLREGSLKDFESIAFIGRRDNDIGVIDDSKLHLAHILPPVDGNGDIPPATSDNRPPVFVKDLLYRGGANWWRFALKASSRYAAMKPNLNLIRYSHIDPETKIDVLWHTLIVRDRDTGRRPKRPGLLLVLPLTETLMSDVAVPPLLAIFSEPMFAGFHIGDGVEAALDYARHPQPDAAIVWTGVEKDAAQAVAKIANAYAVFAGDTTDPDARNGLRLAVATFNAFARTQGVTLAGANVAKAQNKVSDAAAAVGGFQKPVPPARQASYQTALDALNLAIAESADASKILERAQAAVLSAQQLLQSVQQGGDDELPDLQSEMQRFWPQIGPDPILTSAPHSGRPIPLRLDGPIGYTFDLETEAPHFGRSGFLTTPISGQNGDSQYLKIAGLANIKIRPWTLARLRFRRMESVELSLYKPVAVCDKGVPVNLLLSSEAIDLTKAETAAAPVAPPVAVHAGPPAPPPKINPVLPPPLPSLIPPEYHEGLAIDFPELDYKGASATISVLQGTFTTQPPPLWSDRFIKVAASVAPDVLSIFLNSDLGPAGTYDVALRPTSRARLRLVLSQREKPERSEKPYEPVLDVSVRLLIDDGDGDGLARSQVGTWVTVACLPLLAGGKTFRPSDPIYVNVNQDGAAAVAQAAGVRLTSFTAPVWCQFTQDVSAFDVTTTNQVTRKNWPVTKLTANVDSQNLPQLGVVIDDATPPQPLQSIKWLAVDPSSQIRSTVVAVLTEFISDAFDRVRERPLAVYRIEDGVAGGDGKAVPATMKFIWPTSADHQSKVAATKLTGARVRLMSLMHLQLDPTQPPTPPASLADYFNEPFETDINMDTADSPGRILGVSKPIEVSLAK
jgi:hypothetical protein